MDCSPPGSSVHGIFLQRMLEWVAFPFSRGSSWPRDWTQVSQIAGKFFTIWAIRKSIYTYIYIYVHIYIYVYIYDHIHIYGHIHIYVYSFLEDSVDYLSRYLACLVPLSSSWWWAQIQALLSGCPVAKAKPWGTRYLCIKEGPAQGMAQPYLVLAPGSAAKLSRPVSHCQLRLYLLDNPYCPEIQQEDSGRWRLTTYSSLSLDRYC